MKYVYNASTSSINSNSSNKSSIASQSVAEVLASIPVITFALYSSLLVKYQMAICCTISITSSLILLLGIPAAVSNAVLAAAAFAVCSAVGLFDGAGTYAWSNIQTIAL